MTDNHYVRAARQRLKLSQEEFAERLFLDRRTIWRYEKGETVPERKVLQIAKLLADEGHEDA